MRKTGILAALGLVLAALLTAVGPTQSASAAGCGDTYTKIGSNLQHDVGNLLGGVHTWRMEVTAQDCDGYDRVAGIVIRMQKENGRCSNNTPLLHVNNYDFNPNVLASWNPGTRTIDCNGGQTVYNIGWAYPGGTWLVIGSGMTEAERCIGAKVQVDIGPVKDDYNGTVPSVCFNGL